MVGKSEPGAMVCSPPDTICGPLTHRAIFRPLYTQSRSATLPSHWSATQTGVVPTHPWRSFSLRQRHLSHPGTPSSLFLPLKVSHPFSYQVEFSQCDPLVQLYQEKNISVFIGNCFRTSQPLLKFNNGWKKTSWLMAGKIQNNRFIAIFQILLH